MGEEINEIVHEIRIERHHLGHNLNELEMRARALGDWRSYYRRNPALLLGMALSGGLVLGVLAGRGRPALENDSVASVPLGPRPRGRVGRQIEDTWQGITDALLGVAAAKVATMVGNVIPGFSEQLDRRRLGISDDRTRSSASRVS